MKHRKPGSVKEEDGRTKIQLPAEQVASIKDHQSLDYWIAVARLH